MTEYNKTSVFHLLGISHRIANQQVIMQEKISSHKRLYIRPRVTKISINRPNGRGTRMIYDIIMQSMKDNVGREISISFSREEADSTFSGIDFAYKRTILLNEYRFVMEGLAKVSRNPLSKIKPFKMQIDYIFANDVFYEAVYCKNQTIRHLKLLELDYVEEQSKPSHHEIV